MPSGKGVSVVAGRDRTTADLPAAESTLWGLCLSLAILAAASITAVALSVNAPLIRADLGLTPVGVGAIASCVYIGAATSSTTMGRLTDRRGPALVLVIAMLLLASGEAVSLGSPSAALFYVGALVAGLGYGAVNPPTNIVSNPPNARRRGLSMSIKQTGVPLGGMLAGALIPPLAAQYGWRASLILPVGICLSLAVISRRWCPRPTAFHFDPVGAATTVRFRLPRAYVFGFLMGGVQVTIFTFVALYLAEDRGLSTQRAGIGLSLLLVGGLVGRPFWGWLSDRRHHDRVRPLQLTSVIACVGLLLLPLLPLPALAAVLPIVGVTSVGWNGTYIAAVTEAAKPEAIGEATGHAQVLVNLGAVVLPPTFGVIVSRSHSWFAAWTVCAAISLLSAVVLQFSRDYPPVLIGE